MRNWLWILLFAMIGSPALAASNPSTIPTVATIAAMKALGAASAQYPLVYVSNYATANDGGGGIFAWTAASVTAADTCTIFQANGVATGRWIRRLNGTPFNVDMCGTGTSDDSAAFNAGFAVCAAKSLPMTFSAKDYKIQGNLTALPTCTFHGAGSIFNGGLGSILDFSNSATTGIGLSIAGSGGFGTYAQASNFGGFTIYDASGHLSTGLYVSRMQDFRIDDVSVQYVVGCGIKIGSTINVTLSYAFLYGDGSAACAPLEVDGEKPVATEYAGTQATLSHVEVEYDNGNGALCSIKIDRFYGVSLIDSDGELSGIPLCVGTKSSSSIAVQNLFVQNFDAEALSNGATTCFTIGSGWGGTAGRGVISMSMINDRCDATAVTETAAVTLTASTGFYSQGLNTASVTNGAAVFALTGTNSAAMINPSPAPTGVTYNYVTVGGVVQGSAVNNVPWVQGLSPTVYASLPSCTAALKGAPGIMISDDNSVTYNTIAAGGGANNVRVGCDGTNWRNGN